MRLLIPLILGLIGAFIGIVICKLFVRSWLAYPAAALLGAVSAFAGLIARDAFDATLVSTNTLYDSLAAAIAMCIIVSLIANIVTSIVTEPEKSLTNDKDQ